MGKFAFVDFPIRDGRRRRLRVYSVEKLLAEISPKISKALESLKIERAGGPMVSDRDLASIDLKTSDGVFMPGFQPQVDSRPKSSVRGKLVFQQNRSTPEIDRIGQLPAISGHLRG
jgi:hypothetical protein